MVRPTHKILSSRGYSNTHRQPCQHNVCLMLVLGGADIARWRWVGRNPWCCSRLETRFSRKWVVKSPLGHCWLTSDRWDEGESGIFLGLTNIRRHSSEIKINQLVCGISAEIH